MKALAYVCADTGIPLPGVKGASRHVAAVCREFTRAGWSGAIYAARATADRLGGLPLRPLAEGIAEAAGRDVDPPTPEPSCIYERYSLWHLGGLERARRTGIPFLLEVNAPLPEEARRYRSLDDPEGADEIARRLLTEADGIVCVSDEVAAWAHAMGAPRERAWVVPNGVDPETFRPCADRHPSLPGRHVPLIAFSGSFRPWHGLDDLLEAFRQLTVERGWEAHLVCAGDGPGRGAFRQAALAAGLADRVHLPGALPQRELRDWIGAADIAVAPYPRLEGFWFSPLKIFEFMALGLPVVAAALGQAAELVDRGRCGLRYEPGRPDELADALETLLRDRETGARLGAAGRRWVLAHATWRHRLGDILDRAGLS